ncbi:DEAD/DEAH box helicase [Undibacterium sp. WLX3042]|uniref:DEAD/DEAH box helicase n=1 Tax=Undibacterium sp. WLX3042 TaxID=3412686 RepID=UPI003C3004F3
MSIEESARFKALREFSSSHQWGVINPAGLSSSLPSGTELTVIELGLGLLQRGAWTPCSWMVEQDIAHRMQKSGLCQFSDYPSRSGLLGFEPKEIQAERLKLTLTSGRLQSEVEPSAIDHMWVMAEKNTGVEGSSAERQFFDEVLVPVLGFPLLDYLQFQSNLSDLGVESSFFIRQRTDFSIDTGRGLRLVIEIDGRQHYEQEAQRQLDHARDAAIKKCQWKIWRVPVSEMRDIHALRLKLKELLRSVEGGIWATDISTAARRDVEVMSSVWGATIIARIQFLLLVAIKQGVLNSDRPWKIYVEEAETDVAELAVRDFIGWFGRMRGLYGLADLPHIELVTSICDGIDLCIAISCTNPYFEGSLNNQFNAFSRPMNRDVEEPRLIFHSRGYLPLPPEQELLQSFAQDFFRKSELREGQYEILSRILMGQDAVGLLPTGGGKSLTYQLASLLLPGATLYVAPLKSLLQDQYERLKVDGVDNCGFISSALNTDERKRQEVRFISGSMRMLQVAPERFLMANFRSLLSDYQSNFGPIAQVVVDECHCVSEWGHDFRPSYLSLSRIVRDRTARLNNSAPVVALTGTASSIVLDDVCRELGISESAAVIRAKRLDRPELELQFKKIPLSEKSVALGEAAANFLDEFREATDGMLVFTRHVNGSYGVLEIANNLAKTLQLKVGDGIRVYSGERPKAMLNVVTASDWDKQKSQVQRDFISLRDKNSFKILVATSAFGMGIDKPSIRKVIHYLAPPSPEAYYQEVGRAARDRKPAVALMLFSDELAEKTDIILSPQTEIEQAKKIYHAIPRHAPVGDFITMFYFHSARFAGVDEEVNAAIKALSSLKKLVDASKSVVLGYSSDKANKTWNAQATLEYSLVRLIHLGVVSDYTKDFNSKTFDIAVSKDWREAREDLDAYKEYFLNKFEAYVKRYETRRVGPLVQELLSSVTHHEVEKSVMTAIVRYLYSQIERRRRTSTRSMLELAREGVTNIEEARKKLLFYLQASDKFTHELEQIAKGGEDALNWEKISSSVEAPVEVDELHGAVSRVLESYPTHPGLLFLSAISRRNPSFVEKERSREEFEASLKILTELSPDSAADAAEDALTACSNFDVELAVYLKVVYGAWCYRHFGARFALLHIGKDPVATMSIVNEMLSKANQGLPEMLI